MRASSRNQKQTLILLNSRRSALNAPRHLSWHMSRRLSRKLSLLGLGITVGVGLPVLVYASQQPAINDRSQHPSPIQSSDQTDITTSPPLLSEGGISLEVSSDAQGASPPSDSVSKPEVPKAHVTINGEAVPLTNGSISKTLQDNSGNVVDIQVQVDSNSTSQSVSSSDGSVHISVESSSSSTGSATTDDPIRGSPRR
jgi:hypothetical protein